MVSEAVVSGKPVVSFAPQAANGAQPKTKYHRFLRRMDEQGSIRLADPEKVGEEIIQAFKAKGKKPEPEAADPVMEFLTKWL